MEKNRLKTVLIAGGVLVIVAAALIARLPDRDKESPAPAAALDSDGKQWSWENPVTGKTVTLPPEWRPAGDQGSGGALLTLSHWTDGSVVYLVHDETRYDLTLEEYADASQDALRRELGIDKIDCRSPQGESCSGEGAKLLGKTVAVTRVRIWRGRARSFWRAAAVIDPEYRNLMHDAGRIIERLQETAG